MAEYKILYAQQACALELVELVNAALAEGWEPQGGIFTFEGTNNDNDLLHCFGQAMLKRDEYE